MTRPPAGIKLASHDGHSEWRDPVLRPVPGFGWGLVVDCDFGGRPMAHWLYVDPKTGRLDFRGEPYGWVSPVMAFAALDRYRAQEEA